MENCKLRITKVRHQILFVACLAPALAMGFSADDVGTAGAQFLKAGAGARATGMGEAGAGLNSDATSLYWNPAGLANLAGGTGTFMHQFGIEDTFYDYLGYARPIGKKG